MTTESTPRPDALAPATGDRTARLGEILREIATGGLAGLIAGLVVGGVGGRLVMRLAAILVPETTGLTTENGNRIGTITPEGTILLVIFGGLLSGVVAGGIWVVIRPWLPPARGRRALASVPIALAFATPLLIEGDNVDFAILGRDPVVISALLALVAMAGPAIVLVDDWLAHRLPAASHRAALVVYVLITAVGLVFTMFITVPALLQSASAIVLLAIVGVGIATLLRWAGRLEGRSAPSATLERIARAALVAAVALGLGTTALDVLGALGLR